MEDAALVLLILVSSTLTVFLVAMTVLIVLCIKLAKKIQILADEAEGAVKKVSEAGEAAGDAFRSATGSFAFFKLAKNLVKLYKKR